MNLALGFLMGALFSTNELRYEQRLSTSSQESLNHGRNINKYSSTLTDHVFPRYGHLYWYILTIILDKFKERLINDLSEQ